MAAVVLGGCLASEQTRVVSADDAIPDDLAAGDIVRKGDLELIVPPPGEEFFMIVEREDGTTTELALRNPVDGVVELIAPPEAPITLAAGVCDDGAYNLLGTRRTSAYRWRFQASSTPNANSPDAVEAGLRDAVTAITHSRNDCGFADQVSATSDYLGRTSVAPDITVVDGKIRCLAQDGVNVVGFGVLPIGTLGVACVTSAEGDVRLSTRYDWFALDVPGGCSNKFGVRAVATHEFGHVFGLGHVSEANHPAMTMSTKINPCTNAAYSLGWGDVRGLRDLY